MSAAITSQESTEHRPSTAPMRILVAGVGNIFLRDDGFGPEVARGLAADAAPEGVQIVDYGIRGLHLAYDLLAGATALILVDAVPAGHNGTSVEAPGSLRVLRIRSEDVDDVSDVTAAGGGSDGASAARRSAAGLDPHGMDPLAVLRQLRALGGELPATYLVGCVPTTTDEGIGLSEAVTAAVPDAITAVRALITRCSQTGRTPN